MDVTKTPGAEFDLFVPLERGPVPRFDRLAGDPSRVRLDHQQIGGTVALARKIDADVLRPYSFAFQKYVCPSGVGADQDTLRGPPGAPR